MRIGWLVDDPVRLGGAELTQAEFRAAAPDGVEIVDCPPGGIDYYGCERYVVQNCMRYSADELKGLLGFPVFKYHHDVGPWMDPEVRDFLDRAATNICCSPIQAEHMGLDAICIPPPIDLDRFAEAGARVNGSRAGACCVGSWRNYGKAPHKAAEWGQRNGGIEFYGGGELAPKGCREIAYEGMPALLAKYKTLVFLPTVLEPFGRVVAEGWASGCEIVTNGLVGAGYWIAEDPGAIETAAEDFWRIVCS
jgi:glycosyltransferase involved in cell wall biosynthesis